MKTITRRSFLQSSLTTAAALSLPARAWASVPGANGDIRVAVVGFNGRGKSHIEAFRKIKGARVVALCDADRNVLESEAKKFRDRSEPIQTFTDVRQLLHSKEVDVIATATPNHWHALISVWACQAGKDVYVEKPVSHNVWEGRKIVEAARKYNRIVQTGTQSRSSGALREALAWVQAGHLGKIKIARGLCYKPRQSIGKVSAPQPVPSHIDYDLWCGPAPQEPLRRKNLHYDWHWVWPTGNGDIGNQGIHQMDIARWALGKNELSRGIISVGGRFGYEDDGQTPNTQFVVHDFGDALLIFEVRGLPKDRNCQESGQWKGENMDRYKGQGIGHVIECEHGYLAGTTAYDNQGNEIKKFSGEDEGHFENFIQAVRSRKVSDLNADILEGHLSSALCHLGNISHALGKTLRPEEVREKLRSDKAAMECLDRFEAHLA
ncbi:MAG: Gfo/Idh/MocA family oxidoreductase, partial [Verrucomicrobiota bacterium]